MSGLDERAAVLHYLRAQRRSVLAIIGGLDDQQMNTSVVASGWTPAGLLRHLGDAERHWFQEVLAGRTRPPREEVPDERRERTGCRLLPPTGRARRLDPRDTRASTSHLPAA